MGIRLVLDSWDSADQFCSGWILYKILIWKMFETFYVNSLYWVFHHSVICQARQIHKIVQLFELGIITHHDDPDTAPPAGQVRTLTWIKYFSNRVSNANKTWIQIEPKAMFTNRDLVVFYCRVVFFFSKNSFFHPFARSCLVEKGSLWWPKVVLTQWNIFWCSVWEKYLICIGVSKADPLICFSHIAHCSRMHLL